MQKQPPLEDAIGDLPELEGDWWERWQEGYELRQGPMQRLPDRLMRELASRGDEDELDDHITRKVRGDDHGDLPADAGNRPSLSRAE